MVWVVELGRNMYMRTYVLHTSIRIFIRMYVYTHIHCILTYTYIRIFIRIYVYSQIHTLILT